ncbi:MAG: hypothetical protein J5764_04435 [Bacteroidales bacterium]|nr:hypothetical protein [Bacteroidales bacterium]
MKAFRILLAAAVLCIASVSCSKSVAEQMKMAENVKVSCDPEVLAVVGDKVPATITVTYPKGYFNKTAIMTVTPVLVYEGGEEAAEPVTYQGEKVKDNHKVAPYVGGTMSVKVEFPYRKGMESSYLELRPVIFYGKRTYDVPARKVADGCNTTCLLADTKGVYVYKADGYRTVLDKTAEGQIMYEVNSAEVRKSQMVGAVNSFQEAVKAYEADERATVKGTRIVAYASPEGGAEYNSKLSDKRAESAGKAWSKVSGDQGVDVDLRSIGQDWEGFQAAVAASSLEDKELILRVLSMYSDPAVRESEIRNMSQVFTEMKTKVFPALRRARLIADVEYKNYTDEELERIASEQLYLLDESALMHLAANTKDSDRKALLYKIAAESFDSDAARYNGVLVALDNDDALLAAERAKDIKNQQDADILNALGVIALRKGDSEAAAKYFKQSGTPEAQQNMAILDIQKGDYKAAAAKAEGVNKAVASILSEDYNAAEKAISGQTDARSEYLRAIIAARRNSTAAAKKHLDEAYKKDASLKERAAKDVEFAAFEN